MPGSPPRLSPRRGTRRRRADRSPRTAATVLLLYGVCLVALWQAHRPPKPQSKRLAGLSAGEARLANAAIPFAPGAVRPASPFRFRGSAAAREQAVRCLATVAVYEAGEAADGQRAVMQIVLNRLRLPAYPKTVCGVVYQGATLPTGCQFSFSCDRSATRRPERTGWAAARRRAQAALSGAVFRPVGTATHYHADYVLPYWLGSLDKTAVVGQHIFYRPHGAGRMNPAAAAGVRLARDDQARHR